MTVQANIPAIIIANAIGAALMLIVLQNNKWRVRGLDSENNALLAVILFTLFGCVCEAVTFVLDGTPSTAMHYILYTADLILFIACLMIGPFWMYLALHHLFGSVSRLSKLLITAVSGAGAVLLVVNFFYPLVFTVDSDNIYRRGPFFWVYTLIQALFFVYGTALYFIIKSRRGTPLFFPIFQFIIPILLGLAMQYSFYGISTLWPSIAVANVGLSLSLKNGILYRDPLTGLFNRYYLEYFTEKSHNSRKFTMHAVMFLDINGFKHINDRYGHNKGDQALIEAAGILTRVVGRAGRVIRYAGDEFVIIMDEGRPSTASQCIKAINEECRRFNEREDSEFRITFSVGSSTVDFRRASANEILNDIDARMYENKKEYYESIAEDGIVK